MSVSILVLGFVTLGGKSNHATACKQTVKVNNMVNQTEVLASQQMIIEELEQMLRDAVKYGLLKGQYDNYSKGIGSATDEGKTYLRIVEYLSQCD